MKRSIIRDKTEFETMVSTLIRSRGQDSFGKLHLLTFNPEAMDDSRIATLKRACPIIESILVSHLSDTDACLQLTPTKYLLLFPNLSEIEGMVRATAIAGEIRQRLFGENDNGMDVTMQALPPSRLSPSSPPPQQEAGANSMDVHLSAMHRKKDISLKAVFQPVWDAREERVLGARVRIRRTFGSHEMFGLTVLFGGEDDPLAVEANTVLWETVRHTPCAGATLFIPYFVNPHTLGRIKDLEAWIPELLRQKPESLVVELIGGLASVPRPRLRDCIQTVRSAGVQVAIQSVPDAETARFLHDCGVTYLCLSHNQIRFSGNNATVMAAFLTVFAREIEGIGLHRCLWGADTPLAIKRGVSLGFRFFTSHVIGTNSDVPTGLGPKPAKHLFA